MNVKSISVKTLFFTGAAGFMLATTGCEATRNMSNRDKGVAVGAAAGGVVGGVVGNNVGKGNTTLGVLVGAVVGGAVGGVIGAKMDKQAQEIQTEIPGAKVERVEEGINVTFEDGTSGVRFGFDSDVLDAQSKTNLNKMARILNDYPDTDIVVEGHTDNVGAEAYNMGLSRRRANTVTDYLVSQGVKATRITTKWYGETQPAVENDTPENRSKNRRVEMAITANEKMKADAAKEAGQ